MTPRNRFARVLAGAAAVLVSAALLAGCSSDDSAAPSEEDPFAETEFDPGEERPEIEPAPGPWGQEMAEAAAAADSDFIRDILADGQITSDDFAEAVARANQCLLDAGIEPRQGENGLAGAWTTEPDEWGFFGSISLPGATDEEWDALIACRDRYLGDIPELYEAMTINPDNLDHDGLILRCLRDEGLVDASFTVDDLLEVTNLVFWTPSTCTEAQDSPDWIDVVCVDEDEFSANRRPDWTPPAMTLPNGVSLDDGAGAECVWNPLGLSW